MQLQHPFPNRLFAPPTCGAERFVVEAVDVLGYELWDEGGVLEGGEGVVRCVGERGADGGVA